MKMSCEHEYESIDGEEYYLGSLGETVEKKVKCRKCGNIGREIFVYSCTVDE